MLVGFFDGFDPTGFITILHHHVSNEKSPGGCGGIQGIIQPNKMGILTSQYKDPYKPTSYVGIISSAISSDPGTLD